LDRYEEGYAVCEDMDTRDTLTFPSEALPDGVSEGDMLLYDGVNFTTDKKETKSRRRRIKKMYKRLRG